MAGMTGGDHCDAAGNLLAEAESCDEPDTRAGWCRELAKVHRGLSQASAAARALARHEKAAATSGRAAGAGSRGSADPAIGDVAPVPASSQAQQTGPGRPGGTLGLGCAGLSAGPPPGAARRPSRWPLAWDDGRLPPARCPACVVVHRCPLIAVPAAGVVHAR
jgi:hypothetical protein